MALWACTLPLFFSILVSRSRAMVPVIVSAGSGCQSLKWLFIQESHWYFVEPANGDFLLFMY